MTCCSLDTVTAWNQAAGSMETSIACWNWESQLQRCIGNLQSQNDYLFFLYSRTRFPFTFNSHLHSPHCGCYVFCTIFSLLHSRCKIWKCQILYHKSIAIEIRLTLKIIRWIFACTIADISCIFLCTPWIVNCQSPSNQVFFTDFKITIFSVIYMNKFAIIKNNQSSDKLKVRWTEGQLKVISIW